MKRIVAGIVLTLLFMGFWFSTMSVQPAKAGGTIYIRADGSIDPPTAPISTLDNVTYTLTGDIASYDDGIVVWRDNIILDGAGYTIQGTNAFQSEGIDLSERSDVTIKNMSITAFSWGIKLDSSLNNTVCGNTITNNMYGIPLFSSSGNTMYGNNIAGNHYGIWLFASSNNSISGNTFTDDGLFVLHAYGNFVWNNTVNSKPLVYLDNVSDYSVHDAGQVILISCENIRVEGCNLSNTDCGVQLIETKSSIISGNNIVANGNGIWLSDSSNNNISKNNITDSGGHGIIVTAYQSSSNNSISENTIANNGNNGIELEYSNCTSISGNTITNNDRGIELGFTSNCTSISGNTITNNRYDGISLSQSTSNSSVYHNNFVNNTRQAVSSGSTNIWDNGFEGNYWSDYNGIDPDQDGIGDAPYVIDENNQDNCPLMNPYMLGDVNHDAKVNILDISIIAKAFGTEQGDENWDTHSDLDENGKINILDVAAAAKEFGKEWKW